jgi:hypothetical protein
MSRRRWFGLIPAAFLVLAACGSESVPKQVTPQGPTLSIASPANGTSVEGNVVSLDMQATGITIVKADGDVTGKTGHYHVFIDREPVAPGTVIPKEAGIVHSAADPIVLTGLSVGAHTFTVVLGDGTHTRITDVKAQVSATVDGPSVDATAPAAAKVGEALTISVKVQGVTLVKADGDASGKTGHLHVFIDRDPTVAGAPIPKEAGIIHTTETTIVLPAFTTAGEHTVWVVLGNGNHVPFAPSVLDKLVVTVQ